MIYSVTFNPALDVSGFVDSLVPNEKCYVSDEKKVPGGNGINAGVVSSRLGANVRLCGFLGGPHGELIRTLLKKEKVKQSFEKISGETRMNVTISNRMDYQQTRLSFPGPVIKEKEFSKLKQRLHKAKEGDLVLFGGSLPGGLRAGDIFSLILDLKRRKIFVMVDMPGKYLKEVISAAPHFIKPNLTEFQELCGKNVSQISDVIKEAKKIQRKVPYICISSVEGGALFLAHDEIWFGKIPPIKIFSTVGAGDSMVGAMAWAWSTMSEPSAEQLLRKGLAASCATLTEKGLTLGSAPAIKRFSSSIIIKKIKC